MPGMFDAQVMEADYAKPETATPPVEMLESGEESDEADLVDAPKI
jgi:hypothetical protein